MGDIRRIHVFVSGRVQGVFYRASTRDEALRIGGIVGWVHNLWDGRVEVLAEGDESQIDRLLKWLAKGPPAARVDHLEVADEPPQNDLSGFSVRYDG
jgi:acylphosphatase